MLEVILTKGLPGSGKTTWAKAMLKAHPYKYKRVNKDDLRMMVDDNQYSKENEKIILELRDILIISLLKEGKSVIVDDTNLHPKHFARISDIINSNKLSSIAQIKIQDFTHIPLEECIRRDVDREKSIGEKAIRRMYNRYLKDTANIEWHRIQDKSLEHSIICDIDGTIAAKGDRSPYDYNRVSIDLPILPIVELIKTLKNKYNKIIFVSGRDEICRQDTILWLHKVFNWQEDKEYILYMRNQSDTRKDCIIKKDIFEKFIDKKWFIDFVIDDRNQVVDMWRKEMGLTCLQVNYGDF